MNYLALLVLEWRVRTMQTAWHKVRGFRLNESALSPSLHVDHGLRGVHRLHTLTENFGIRHPAA